MIYYLRRKLRNPGFCNTSDITINFDITVEGVVEDTWASDFNLTGCEAAPTRGIEIIDDNGDTWHLGVALTDEDGQRLDTPNLAFTGRDVTLTYRYRKPWGDVSGYVLSDRDGLVAAADEVRTPTEPPR